MGKGASPAGEAILLVVGGVADVAKTSLGVSEQRRTYDGPRLHRDATVACREALGQQQVAATGGGGGGGGGAAAAAAAAAAASSIKTTTITITITTTTTTTTTAYARTGVGG